MVQCNTTVWCIVVLKHCMDDQMYSTVLSTLDLHLISYTVYSAVPTTPPLSTDISLNDDCITLSVVSLSSSSLSSSYNSIRIILSHSIRLNSFFLSLPFLFFFSSFPLLLYPIRTFLPSAWVHILHSGCQCRSC